MLNGRFRQLHIGQARKRGGRGDSIQVVPELGAQHSGGTGLGGTMGGVGWEGKFNRGNFE